MSQLWSYSRLLTCPELHFAYPFDAQNINSLSSIAAITQLCRVGADTAALLPRCTHSDCLMHLCDHSALLSSSWIVMVVPLIIQNIFLFLFSLICYRLNRLSHSIIILECTAGSFFRPSPDRLPAFRKASAPEHADFFLSPAYPDSIAHLRGSHALSERPLFDFVIRHFWPAAIVLYRKVKRCRPY